MSKKKVSKGSDRARPGGEACSSSEESGERSAARRAGREAPHKGSGAQARAGNEPRQGAERVLWDDEVEDDEVEEHEETGVSVWVPFPTEEESPEFWAHRRRTEPARRRNYLRELLSMPDDARTSCLLAGVEAAIGADSPRWREVLNFVAGMRIEDPTGGGSRRALLKHIRRHMLRPSELEAAGALVAVLCLMATGDPCVGPGLRTLEDQSVCDRDRFREIDETIDRLRGGVPPQDLVFRLNRFLESTRSREVERRSRSLPEVPCEPPLSPGEKKPLSPGEKKPLSPGEKKAWAKLEAAGGGFVGPKEIEAAYGRGSSKASSIVSQLRKKGLGIESAKSARKRDEGQDPSLKSATGYRLERREHRRSGPSD